VKLGAMMGAGAMLPLGLVEKAFAFNLLGQAPAADPSLLTKYIDALPIPGVMPQVHRNYYEVGAYPFKSSVHSQIPATNVWGYRPNGFHPTRTPQASYLGPSFVVTQGTPITVKWLNNLVDASGKPIRHPLPVDPSLHWAAPFGDNMLAGPFPVDANGNSTFDYTLKAVPIAPHVHGAEVEPSSDGGPNSWFTPYWAQRGADWQHKDYHYTNGQPPATIWYHDHAMGMTRLNVYMGLAGAFVVTNPRKEPKGLPSGKYDIPLVLQDRMFDVNGQLFFPAVSDHPTINPFWVPEFFGDHMLVNGKVWPVLDVEPRAYRFRVLDGSNARFYRLWLELENGGAPGPAMYQIATDGGYLNRPVKLSDAGQASALRLLVAPGERAEVVVDFSKFAGKTLLLRNDAQTPFPMDGTPLDVDADDTTLIMKFRVGTKCPQRFCFPDNPLNPSLAAFPSLNTHRVARTRVLTLNEIESPVDGNPLVILLNLTKFMAPVTEMPKKGTTEIWKVVNMTPDTHPIHTHLTQFQLVSRQKFDRDAYAKAFAAVNGTTPIDGMTPNDAGKLKYTPVDPTPFLIGSPVGPDANERGWKDTARNNFGEVTTFVARWAPIDSSCVKPYPFDPTAKPGYVWHCHIIDHEDNEMMRPYRVVR
jgi:spore coat protein A, manganese oxidase